MDQNMEENSTTIYDNYSNNYYDISDESCNKTEVIHFGAVVTPVFFTMVIVFSCVGNALVLWVLIKYENLRSMTNAFLLNLAISDLIFTLGLPFWGLDLVFGWTFGESACKSVSFIFYLGFYSSLIFLTVMTVHRYMAVVHPLSMLLNSTTYYSIGISAFIWFLSFCAATPYFIFSVVSSHPDSESFHFCHFNDIKWKLIGIYLQNIFFLIAFLTIAFCYIEILKRLLRPMSHTRPKTVKLILCIVVAFYLGWTPYNVAIFLDSLISFQISPFNECHVSTTVDYVFNVSRLVAFSHCCLNPVFYVFMGVKFRDHLKKALRSFCRGNDQPTDKRHSHLITSNGEEISMY
ncbi:chemokine XC receptor 1 [Clarias gariepinus]|uniref:chemokine XC receptor 1 n=1 Tax=Clarias gariepinus TaxID=13013 RepID=UPI00234D422E|nr:chemokine XC receptor 1 [Clarias gariepinus]